MTTPGHEVGVLAQVIRQAAIALAGSRDAALVMKVPSGLILASTPSASLLLQPDGPGEVVGHHFDEFTGDEPDGALALFADRRISGCEVDRVLARDGEPDVRVRFWCRRIDHRTTSPFALILLSRSPVADPNAPAATDRPADPVDVARLRSALVHLCHIAALDQREQWRLLGRKDQDLPGLTDLTLREREIMGRLVAGYRVSSIAKDLVLSPSTVRTHLASIFAKLGVSSQDDLLSALRSSRPNLGWSTLYPTWHDEP